MATKATKTSATATTTPVETKANVASTTEAKATTKKASATKKAADKETATTKVATKKASTTTKKTTKVVEPQVSYLLQFSGKEVNTANVLETVKKIWVEKFQGKLEDIKTIELYFKPEESRAYFVVNGLSNGDYFVEL